MNPTKDFTFGITQLAPPPDPTFDFKCPAIFTTKQRISFSVPLADGVILWQSYLDT